jgi:hypothetical protein
MTGPVNGCRLALVPFPQRIVNSFLVEGFKTSQAYPVISEEAILCRQAGVARPLICLLFYFRR